MNIEKAIENIEEVLKLDCHIKYPEWIYALNLGIEALKAVKDARTNNYYTPIAPLLGETKD